MTTQMTNSGPVIMQATSPTSACDSNEIEEVIPVSKTTTTTQETTVFEKPPAPQIYQVHPAPIIIQEAPRPPPAQETTQVQQVTVMQQRQPQLQQMQPQLQQMQPLIQSGGVAMVSSPGMQMQTMAMHPMTPMTQMVVRPPQVVQHVQNIPMQMQMQTSHCVQAPTIVTAMQPHFHQCHQHQHVQHCHQHQHQQCIPQQQYCHQQQQQQNYTHHHCHHHQQSHCQHNASPNPKHYTASISSPQRK